MSRRISWTNNSTDYLGSYVYRGQPLDTANLPEPVGQVGPVALGATAEWIGGEELAVGDYDYAVRDFNDMGMGQVSAVVTYTVGNEAAPGTTDGLVVLYQFADPVSEGGLVVDISDNGHDATMTTSSLTQVQGKFGNAVEVVPQAEMDIPIAAAPTPGDFSITCWVKLTAATDDFRVFSMHSPDYGNYQFILWAGHSSGNLRLYVYGATATTSTNPPPTGVWFHVALTRSGTTQRVYLNGVEEIVESDGNNFPQGSSLRFWWNPNSANGMDDWRLYNRALSQTEIQEMIPA